MNSSQKFIFRFLLVLGTLMTISSSSWIGMWMGLELNLLSFIPLMITSNNLNHTEAAIKYFLIQAFASMVFLFISIIYILKISLINFMQLSYESLIINSSMMLKLGAAPFHFWLPEVIKNISWSNSLILLTWQKLAPLTIISYFSIDKTLIVFIIMSSMVGALGGLNQTSLQKLLAYSSINHIGWMLTAEIHSNYLWINYFIIYAIINFSIIILFKNLNMFNINQLFFMMNSNNKNLMLKSFFFINFLSLGGLPPFLGFLPKWLVIEHLMKTNYLFLIFFMIMMNLITLFFYIRLTMSAFSLNYPSMKWNFVNLKNSKNLYFMIFMNFLNIILFSLTLILIY
uniref:NADH-ubiquinone oxidoreductase chain 2 n=1 Tax=Culicoides wadai TaxID=469754 RepID=A8B0S4_9DIPT|nr:NADH dehydrogenase subunit 2 [Culicoides wadai]